MKYRGGKLTAMAAEWARELVKFNGPAAHVALPIIGWGFDEIEKGRNPDVVLKEVIAKIEEKLDADHADVPVPRVQPPH